MAAAVVDRFTDLGLSPIVAFELEFYLFDREPGPDGTPQAAISKVTGEREESTQVYGIHELDAFGDFFHDHTAGM